MVKGLKGQNMRNTSEKFAILALSLMLVSTYSISAILPSLLGYYEGYAPSQVDLLISIPSFVIMIMILVNTWLAEYLNERLMITGGLLLLSVSGIAPLFIHTYALVLFSRIFLGLGIGLINSRAVSMISERFDGSERTALLGYRSSAETLGNAVLTFIAGRLLLIHWTMAFLIYSFGFVILVLYLVFVPYGSKPDRDAVSYAKSHKTASGTFSRNHILMTLFHAVSAGFLICTSSSISLRLPLLVLEKGYADESQASTVLGVFLVIGIISGILYRRLLSLAHERLFLFSVLACCVGLIVMAQAGTLTVLGVGAVISGLAHTAAITCVFNGVSSHLPVELVHAATSMVLVGCNLGAFTTPFITGFAEKLRPGTGTAFYTCCGLLLAAGILNTVFYKFKPELAIVTVNR